MKVGKNIKQASGYRAFIPEAFPPTDGYAFSDDILQKANEATLLLGKINGISTYLPDVDFFLLMYMRKDAASSSQIEGTRATMIDAILSDSGIKTGIPEDVDDIKHYIDALHYAFDRLKDFPMSLPLIKEVHKVLMMDARSTHFSDPGNFRKTQNWIGGTTPDDATFVPPPPHEMTTALKDLELFMHYNNSVVPILKIGLIHSQFETIHPFLDGNGRIGRILITLLLHIFKLLDKPILFVSSYFKKHQQAYYDTLSSYHKGDVERWLNFFLNGIVDTSNKSIELITRITILVEKDGEKLKTLNKRTSTTAEIILKKLYSLPIVDTTKVMEWTGFSRPGAQKIIDKLVKMEILTIKDSSKNYGRMYEYKEYLEIFEKD